MEYKKIIYLLDNTPNHPSKCKTKHWVKTDDESHTVHNIYSQIKFKLQCKGEGYVIIVMRT